MSGTRTGGRYLFRPGGAILLVAIAVAALAMVLVVAPRVAGAATSQMIGGAYNIYSNTSSSTTVTVTIPDAIGADEVLVAHVAGTMVTSQLRCITAAAGPSADYWGFPIQRQNQVPGGSSRDHAASLFVATGPLAPGSTHTFQLLGGGNNDDCVANNLDGITRGITAVITRWQGVDVDNPIHASSNTGGSSSGGPGRAAPGTATAPNGAAVLHLFSFQEWHNAGRIGAANCSNSDATAAGRIYGGAASGNSNGDMPGIGDNSNREHSLGAFAIRQGAAGPTAAFSARYCESGSTARSEPWTAFTLVLNPIPPAVTKTGLVTPANTPYTWNITIDNSHDFAVDNWEVVITDPNVTLAANADCSQAGDVITCPDVDAGDVIVLTVTRPTVITSCAPLITTNSITALTRTSGPVVNTDLGDWLENVPTTVSGNLLLCPPLYPATPTPTPSPTATATATPTATPVTGCASPAVPAATFVPTPAPQGSTITIWGGGNASQFPPATSFWTTVNGKWVGYIPGAPAWVNATFMQHFPNGEVPACTGFIVFRR